MPARPNILLLTADQMRADAVACNGSPFFCTPNLDALAARGVTFTHAFSPDPICVPGRAALTTGNYPHLCTGHKSNSGRIRDDQVKLAEHFGRAGYATYAIGKLHYVPYSPPGEPRLVHGFDVWESCESGRILAQFDPQGKQRGLEDYFDYLGEVGWFGYTRAHGIGNNDVHAGPSPVPAEHHEECWVATRSVARMEQHLLESPDRPFLLWASFAKPHSPYDPPEPYNRRYDPREIPGPVGSLELLADRDPMLRTQPVAYGWNLLSPEAVRYARAHYFGMVSFQDEMIGRLVEALRRTGQLENTIILYTADHGDLLGDFGNFFKSSMFEGSVGIPFIAAGPGIAARREPCPELVGLQDVLPTLADLAGVPLPRSVQGQSLASLLADSGASGRELFISQCLDSPRQRAMVRTRRWKYVYHELGGVEELYDVEDDPHELRNLAATRPQVTGELHGVLLDWCRSEGDEALLDGGDLRTSPEDAAAVTGFQAHRMGWRWY